MLSGPINAILLSPEFSTSAELLVLTENGLFCSPDGGRSWDIRPAAAGLETQITTVVAPTGYTEKAMLLVGLFDGRVLRV